MITRRDALGLVRAIFAAAALFIAGGMIPVVGALLMTLAPVPILNFAVGFPYALGRMLVAVALTGGLVAFGTSPLAAAAYGVTFGVATVVMSLMLERRQSLERIVLGTAAAMLVVAMGAALVMTGSPAALADVLRHDLTLALQHGTALYKRAGIEAGISADTQALVVDTLLRLSPALVALSAAVTALVNLGVLWRLRRRQAGLGYALFGDLARWSAPEWLIWVLIVTGFGLFIPVAALRTIALDCFVCVVAVYLCQGLAIMAFYFKLLAMPGLARGLIYFVTMVQPVLAVLVCVAGILDFWIDFRRLRPPSREARNFGDFS